MDSILTVVAMTAALASLVSALVKLKRSERDAESIKLKIESDGKEIVLKHGEISPEDVKKIALILSRHFSATQSKSEPTGGIEHIPAMLAVKSSEAQPKP